MKPLFLILTLIIMTNCNNDDIDSQTGYNLESQIQIYYKKTNGDNLLDDNTVNHLNFNDFKLFYEVNGNVTEVNDPNADYRKNMEIVTSGTPAPTLYLFTNNDLSNIVSDAGKEKIVENVAYIQLSETDTDTIRTHSKTSKGYFLVSKVWYNDKLAWEREYEGIIEIIK